MLIRREDFKEIKELTRGSGKRVWFICDNCGIGVLRPWNVYIKSEYDLCKSCGLKKRWQNEAFKKSVSQKISDSWKNNNDRKIVHSKRMKELWKDENFQISHKESLQKKEHKEKISHIVKERWQDQEYREKISNGLKKKWQDQEYRKFQQNIRSCSVNEIKDFLSSIGYVYINSIFENGYQMVEFECDKGHIGKTRLSSLKYGHRCAQCFGLISQAEKEIAEFTKILGFDIIENDRNIIAPKELDIVIPEKKIAIEYCGLYWHSEQQGKEKNYHLNKLERCKDKEYRLITIFEDEWINEQEETKEKLKDILNGNEKITKGQIDRRWINESLYEQEGKTIKNIIPPKAWYFDSKILCRQDVYSNGFYKIWDCGYIEYS